MIEHVADLAQTVVYNCFVAGVLFCFFFSYRTIRAKPGTAYSEMELSAWHSFWKVVFIEDSELASHIKLEGYHYLNFIKILGFFLVFCTVLTILTLLPIYSQMELTSETSLSHLSIQNKEVYEGYLLVPAICTLILAFSTYIVVYSYIMLPTIHPTLFPSEETIRALTIQSCTLQFEGLAKEIPFSRVGHYIETEINQVCSERILFTKSYPDYDPLMKLYSRKCELFYKLEKIGLDQNDCWGLIRRKKEKLIRELKVTEGKLKEAGLLCENRNIGYGFIYCENERSRAAILESVNSQDFKLKAASADVDLVWENLSSHSSISFLMKLASNSIFIFTFLILLTPLTLSSLISQTLEDLSLSLNFLSLSLSSILLSIFQYLIIPYSIRLLVSRELHSLKSEESASRMFKSLLYSIMNIILFPLIGSYTLTLVLEKMLDSQILEWNALLSRNICKVGDFFVNFVLSMAFVSNSLDLLAFSTFFIGQVNRWQAVSHNEELRAMLAPDFDFAHEYSKVLTIFSVTLVFSISTPLILPFGLVYMAIKFYVDKYNLLFAFKVNSTDLPTSPKTVVTCVLVISSLFQIINSGLFIASGDLVLTWLGGILSALSVITLIFSIILHKFWHLVQNYSLGDFLSMKQDFALRYLHPCEGVLSDMLIIF